MPVETTATATATDAGTGTSPEAIRAALPAPAMRTLVGRMLLVSDPASPPWRGGVLGWRARSLARARWAVWQARWLALRRFDLRLAVASWHGHPNGHATVVCDGISLRSRQGGMELLIRCPNGYDPHPAPAADALALAELFIGGLTDRTTAPWGCPPECPGALVGNGRLQVVTAPTAEPTAEELTS